MRKNKVSIFIVVILILLLLQPSRYFISVKTALLLFTASVLPSMLPYFFFTKIFAALGGAESMTRYVGKPVSKMYGVSSRCSYAFVMSLLGGYPIGARVLADMYEKGMIDERDAVRAMSFCSTSGSMFVLGTVGANILGNVRAGWVILLAHYLGAVVNGFIHCAKGRKGEMMAHPMPIMRMKSDTLLSEAMYESVLSLALVGGFIAVTNLAADMTMDGVSFLGLKAGTADTLLSGSVYSFFEVTRGCVVFSQCALPFPLIVALSAAAVSFGGLSVFFQSIAFLGSAGLGGGRMLIIKSTQAVVTFVLCYPLSLLLL